MLGEYDQNMFHDFSKELIKIFFSKRDDGRRGGVSCFYITMSLSVLSIAVSSLKQKIPFAKFSA